MGSKFSAYKSCGQQYVNHAPPDPYQLEICNDLKGAGHTSALRNVAAWKECQTIISVFYYCGFQLIAVSQLTKSEK